MRHDESRVASRIPDRASSSASQKTARVSVSKVEKSEKTSIVSEKSELKAPKRSIFHKKDQKMNLYASLIHRSRAKKEAKAKREAEELSKLPKDPVKRFFARLHPKRVFRFIFSKKGLFFFLKSAAVLFLLSVIAIGGLLQKRPR